MLRKKPPRFTTVPNFPDRPDKVTSKITFSCPTAWAQAADSSSDLESNSISVTKGHSSVIIFTHFIWTTGSRFPQIPGVWGFFGVYSETRCVGKNKGKYKQEKTIKPHKFGFIISSCLHKSASPCHWAFTFLYEFCLISTVMYFPQTAWISLTNILPPSWRKG